HGVTYREFEEQGILLPVVDAQCAYKASARYDDLVRLETTVTALTPARISFAYRATRADRPAPGAEPRATLLAEGRTDHVFVTRDGRVARLNRHPHLWRALAPALAAARAGGPGAASPGGSPEAGPRPPRPPGPRSPPPAGPAALRPAPP